MQELKDQEAHFVAAMKQILKPQGRAIFDAIGATNVDELYSALVAFPSLAGTDGFDFPHVTTIAHSVSGKVLANFMEENAQFVHSSNQISFSLGATPPSDSQWSINVQVPLPVSSEVASPTEHEAPSVQVGNQVDCPWPVKDQGQRGTCVAFAVAALREARLCKIKKFITPLSEQFLYWATKSKYCTNPNTDGTRIRHAVTALKMDGICTEQVCHYNPAPGPSPAQAAPSPQAIANAKTYAIGSYISQSFTTTSALSTVLSLLRISGAVAVSLPVFADPQQPNGPTNWTTPVGRRFGVVLNPPPTSVVVDGHAVCITTFEPDPIEPSGGYFVFRNSWGTNWGAALPSPSNSRASSPGYGQVSATYIDKYLWEAARL